MGATGDARPPKTFPAAAPIQVARLSSFFGPSEVDPTSQDAFGRIPDSREINEESRVRELQGDMADAARPIGQAILHWECADRQAMELGQPIVGAIHYASLRHPDPLVVQGNHPEVEIAKHFFGGLKVEPVGGRGDEGFLPSTPCGRPMKIHADLAARRIDVHIGGGDMTSTTRDLRKMQGSGLVYGPRSFKPIGESEPNKASLVMSKIEVVLSERRQPIRRANERWPVDVVAIRSGEHHRSDNRIQGEALDA